MRNVDRTTLALVCGLVVAGVAGSPASAQSWPSKPIRMIVNFAAGGSTDVIARSLAPRLSEALGQPVLVENRVGAGGNIGLEAVARAAPDGHTLLHSSDGTLLINPFLYDMPVDVVKDLIPVAPTGRSAIFLVVRNGLPVKTLPEFVAYARANPGKLNYGSAGAGTLQHVATELFAREAKIDVVHVAYKGSQQALVDLLGGQIDFTFDLGAAIEQIKADKVRLLAVPTATRSPIFPNTPTMIEAGTNMTIQWLSGVYAPAGTPRDVVNRLNKEINRIMQTPEARTTLATMAAEPAIALGPEEFAASQQKARERFGAIVKEAGIKLK
jgi:tripartite-type tricarboxylate transporter receptor subunit TctC